MREALGVLWGAHRTDCHHPSSSAPDPSQYPDDHADCDVGADHGSETLTRDGVPSP